MTEEKNTSTQPEERKSLLQECNGNYLLAASKYFDSLPVPKAVRQTLKGLLIGVAALTALCALLWPLVMRFL